jgi:hypothetical protein
MRFLTVPELLPRRVVAPWYDDWSRRVDLFVPMGSPTDETRTTTTEVLYNEGTLLLYRLGDVRGAKSFCLRALRLRRSPSVAPPPLFLVQQWINLIRLNAATRQWRSFERRLDLLAAATPLLGDLVEADALRKMARAYVVERLSAVLTAGTSDSLNEVLEGIPDFILEDIAPCALETELRCLIRENRIDAARAKVDTALDRGDGLFALALLILKANVAPLSKVEGERLTATLRLQLRQIPVHVVQMAQFLFEHQNDANVALSSSLTQELLSASTRVGDHVSESYFRARLNQRPLGPARGVRQATVNLQLREQVQARLSLLLQQLPPE